MYTILNSLEKGCGFKNQYKIEHINAITFS